MPRRPRVHLDGVPLHIVQRGHNRQRCFFADADYHCYLRWLDEALAQCDCSLHAYVLMTNHAHLLLTPRKAELVPKLVISLGRRYVQHVNRRYGRTGTLWDSRYKSSLVHAEAYLLACQRYIELNPVRAGMAEAPGHYRWTSYHANATGQPNAVLTPHSIYLALGREPEERRAIYRDLLHAQLLTRRSASFASPSGNASHWATLGFTPRLSGERVCDAKRGHAAGRRGQPFTPRRNNSSLAPFTFKQD